MSARPFGLSVRGAGIAVAAMAAIDAAMLSILALTHARHSTRPGSAVAWLGGGVAFHGLVLGLLAVALFAGFRFGKHRRAGLACLVATSALWEIANASTGNLFVEQLAPGAALFGWLFGRWAARAEGATTEDETDAGGLRGAAATVGVGYAVSVFSKLRLAGLAWLSPSMLWSTIYAHRSMDAHGPSRALADLVLSSRPLATGLASTTLLLEITTLLLIGPARLRQIGAAAVIATHCGFLLVHGSTNPVPPATAAIFFFEARRAAKTGPRESLLPRRPTGRLLALSGVVVVLGVVGGLLLGR